MSLFLFFNFHETLRKPGDFVGSSHISFPSSTHRPYGPYHFPCIWHMCVVLYRLPSGSILQTFEASQGRWDVLFDPLYTLAYLHFHGNMRLVECLDAGVGFDFFQLFLIIIIFKFLTPPPFSQGYWHLFCCQRQIATPDNSLGSVEFLMPVSLALSCMEDFHF